MDSMGCRSAEAPAMPASPSPTLCRRDAVVAAGSTERHTMETTATRRANGAAGPPPTDRPHSLPCPAQPGVLPPSIFEVQQVRKSAFAATRALRGEVYRPQRRCAGERRDARELLTPAELESLQSGAQAQPTDVADAAAVCDDTPEPWLRPRAVRGSSGSRSGSRPTTRGTGRR